MLNTVCTHHTRHCTHTVSVCQAVDNFENVVYYSTTYMYTQHATDGYIELCIRVNLIDTGDQINGNDSCLIFKGSLASKIAYVANILDHSSSHSRYNIWI